VRRAQTQIQALFVRHGVEVFPRPVRPSRFFLRRHRSGRNEERQKIRRNCSSRPQSEGRAVADLSRLAVRRQRAYVEAGSGKNPENPADPYMTLVGYFNSLRELGEAAASLRMKSVPVCRRIRGACAGRNCRSVCGSPDSIRRCRTHVARTYSQGRRIQTAFALPFTEKERVDVALATNMISVGWTSSAWINGILGQPKMTAEYIQATSRVGREDTRPGLVVTLLNIHGPGSIALRTVPVRITNRFTEPSRQRVSRRSHLAPSIAYRPRSPSHWRSWLAAIDGSIAGVEDHRPSFEPRVCRRDARTTRGNARCTPTKAEAAEFRQKLKARVGTC